MLAHIAGIPVEETALSLAPIAAATGGVASLKWRQRRGRRRPSLADPRRVAPATGQGHGRRSEPGPAERRR